MKRTSIAAYMGIPALLTVGAFVVALTREPFGIEMFSAYVVGGFQIVVAGFIAILTRARPTKPDAERS
jgi:hypothetical protein